MPSGRTRQSLTTRDGGNRVNVMLLMILYLYLELSYFMSHILLVVSETTVLVHRLSHKKWRETKQQMS